MSLLLNGAKTATIAGTEMQVIEIYTGEAYTLPLAFTDPIGNPVDCSTWTLGISAKFYTVANVTYGAGTAVDTIILGNLTLNTTQPNVAAYSDLAASWITASTGHGYIYLPATLTGGTGSPPTPVIALANDAANTCLIITTLVVSRSNGEAVPKTNTNREPIGLLVRYQ